MGPTGPPGRPTIIVYCMRSNLWPSIVSYLDTTVYITFFYSRAKLGGTCLPMIPVSLEHFFCETWSIHPPPLESPVRLRRGRSFFFDFSQNSLIVVLLHCFFCFLFYEKVRSARGQAHRASDDAQSTRLGTRRTTSWRWHQYIYTYNIRSIW